jgi:hypothetical protein
VGTTATWLGLGLTVGALACTKPEPPKLTPKGIRVTSVTSTGLGVEADVDAENPNGFELSATAFTGRLVLDGKLEAGTVRVDQPFALPAHATTELRVPMTFAWSSLAAVAPMATRASVPYTVDGTVTIGGRLSLAIPYALSGTLTQAELVKIVASSLPRLPGLLP